MGNRRVLVDHPTFNYRDALSHVRRFFHHTCGKATDFVRSVAAASILAAAHTYCSRTPVPLQACSSNSGALVCLDTCSLGAFTEDSLSSIDGGVVGSAWMSISGTSDAYSSAVALLLRVAVRAFPEACDHLVEAVARAIQTSRDSLAERMEKRITDTYYSLVQEGFIAASEGEHSGNAGRITDVHRRASTLNSHQLRGTMHPPQRVCLLVPAASAVVSGAAATAALLALHDVSSTLFSRTCELLLNVHLTRDVASGSGADSAVASTRILIDTALRDAANGDCTASVSFVLYALEKLVVDDTAAAASKPPSAHVTAAAPQQEGKTEQCIQALQTLAVATAVAGAAAMLFSETLRGWQLCASGTTASEQQLRCPTTFEPVTAVAAVRRSLALLSSQWYRDSRHGDAVVDVHADRRTVMHTGMNSTFAVALLEQLASMTVSAATILRTTPITVRQVVSFVNGAPEAVSVAQADASHTYQLLLPPAALELHTCRGGRNAESTVQAVVAAWLREDHPTMAELRRDSTAQNPQMDMVRPSHSLTRNDADGERINTASASGVNSTPTRQVSTSVQSGGVTFAVAEAFDSASVGYAAPKITAREAVARNPGLRLGDEPVVDPTTRRTTVAAATCSKCSYQNALEIIEAGGKRKADFVCEMCHSTLGWCCDSDVCVSKIGLHPIDYCYADAEPSVVKCEWCSSEQSSGGTMAQTAAPSARGGRSRGFRGGRKRGRPSAARAAGLSTSKASSSNKSALQSINSNYPDADFSGVDEETALLIEDSPCRGVGNTRTTTSPGIEAVQSPCHASAGSCYSAAPVSATVNVLASIASSSAASYVDEVERSTYVSDFSAAHSTGTITVSAASSAVATTVRDPSLHSRATNGVSRLLVSEAPAMRLLQPGIPQHDVIGTSTSMSQVDTSDSITADGKARMDADADCLQRVRQRYSRTQDVLEAAMSAPYTESVKWV